MLLLPVSFLASLHWIFRLETLDVVLDVCMCEFLAALAMSDCFTPHGLEPWFPRRGYWSAPTPFPSPGDLPNPGIKPESPELHEMYSRNYLIVWRTWSWNTSGVWSELARVWALHPALLQHPLCAHGPTFPFAIPWQRCQHSC